MVIPLRLRSAPLRTTGLTLNLSASSAFHSIFFLLTNIKFKTVSEYLSNCNQVSQVPDPKTGDASLSLPVRKTNMCIDPPRITALTLPARCCAVGRKTAVIDGTGRQTDRQPTVT